jgi:hypothetical protein
MLILCLILGIIAYIAMVISFLKKIGDDSWWVKGTPKNVRIKETLNDIGFVTLGVIAYSGFGCLFIYMAFLL